MSFTGICWYCHWGWPKEVVAIYRKYGEDDLDYGPGHIVWGDENFGRHSVQSCLDKFDRHKGGMTRQDIARHRKALKEMLALPDDIRDPCPPEYDGEHPEHYPPSVEMERP